MVHLITGSDSTLMQGVQILPLGQKPSFILFALQSFLFGGTLTGSCSLSRISSAKPFNFLSPRGGFTLFGLFFDIIFCARYLFFTFSSPLFFCLLNSLSVLVPWACGRRGKRVHSLLVGRRTYTDYNRI